MPAEWFYQLNGFRRGPVQPGVLRQLAASGEVTPETLIWREGLPQWAKAGSVRGLFPQQPTESPATISASPPDPAPTSARDDTSPVLNPVVEALLSGTHPFSLFITALRSVVPESLMGTISRLAGWVGIYSAYVAAALLLFGGTVFSFKVGKLMPVGIVLGAAVGLLVLQFVSQCLLSSLEATVTSNKTKLASLAVPDSVFAIIAAATVGIVGALIWYSYPDITSVTLVAITATLVAGAFAALVSLHPQSIGIVISPECRAAEEAVGVFTFLMKVAVRCVPIFFASFMVVGTYRLACVAMQVMRQRGFDLEFLGTVVAVLTLLFAGIAMPVSAYLLTLLYYLTLDVISAIVSIPGKLDVIAVAKRNGDA